MHEPDHEEDEEIEDPGVDEHMDTGIRIKSQRREEETTEEYGHDDAPDILEDEMT